MMKNNNLIAVHGKIGHGKDTVGNIIQILTALPHLTDKGVESFLGREIDSPYKIKKFADKLKDMVCLLIGCTREQLECREFKEKELDEEWWYYKTTALPNGKFYLLPYVGNEKKEYIYKVIKTTPRLLLQLLGTECGRNIIHPNIWCNSLFADYYDGSLSTNSEYYISNPLSKWIITDLRFPNEFEAIKDRGGITIKVQRPEYCSNCPMEDLTSQDCGDCAVYQDEIYQGLHYSEVALDGETRWDYIIDNNGTIIDLIQKVRLILMEEKLI